MDKTKANLRSITAARNENNAVIEYLKELLRRAKDGEIVAFSAICENNHGEQEYL